ncbi:hypothetical protein CVT25_011397 [Psilocybe cyanescens]|uniref:Methyltransferase domain-containing protein n=1 Tax=Psilocybe cyanescens TaxID=93625 RepID=A0A409WGI8_PSICY|nr:hypothetical protein CVT25_011397 [Psilocybe cyanescens]
MIDITQIVIPTTVAQTPTSSYIFLKETDKIQDLLLKLLEGLAKEFGTHRHCSMSHQHHHNSEGQHGHGSDVAHKDYASANKEHYANATSSEENPKWIELARRSARAILARYPFDEESTSVMDFACNRGLLSKEIAGHTKLLVGVDISQTPVDLFNEHVSNQGIPQEEMRAVCIELKGEEGELDGLKFDVITCAASYHHFESIDTITKTLAFFLKPSGVLFVVDITPKESEGSSAPDQALFPEKYRHVVAHHHGLSEGAMKAAFDGAGLTSFSFEPISPVQIHEHDAILFIAKGVKPAV